MTDSIPDKVCATCLQPLNRWHYAGNETWVHPGGHADHEPLPIPRSEATHVHNVCDFCGTDHNVVWVYPTRGQISSIMALQRFTDERDTTRVGKHTEKESNRPGGHKDLAENRFSDKWTACEKCSELIEIPDMERLITYLRRFKPEVFAQRTRTLLRQHFGEFFRLKLPRQPLDEATGPEPLGTGHNHAVSGRQQPPDPDGLPVNIALLDELVGAGIDRCSTCQDVMTTQVVADPVTAYGLVDLACRATDDRLGFVPGGMRDPARPGNRPGVQSLGFRRVVYASDGGTERPAAARVAATLSDAERRMMVNEALDLLIALLTM